MTGCRRRIAYHTHTHTDRMTWPVAVHATRTLLGSYLRIVFETIENPPASSPSLSLCSCTTIIFHDFANSARTNIVVVVVVLQITTHYTKDTRRRRRRRHSHTNSHTATRLTRKTHGFVSLRIYFLFFVCFFFVARIVGRLNPSKTEHTNTNQKTKKIGTENRQI